MLFFPLYVTATVFGHRQRSQLPGRHVERRRLVAKGSRPRQRRRRLELQPRTTVRRVPVLPVVQGSVALPSYLHMRIVFRKVGDVSDVP